VLEFCVCSTCTAREAVIVRHLMSKVVTWWSTCRLPVCFGRRKIWTSRIKLIVLLIAHIEGEVRLTRMRPTIPPPLLSQRWHLDCSRLQCFAQGQQHNTLTTQLPSSHPPNHPAIFPVSCLASRLSSQPSVQPASHLSHQPCVQPSICSIIMSVRPRVAVFYSMLWQHLAQRVTVSLEPQLSVAEGGDVQTLLQPLALLAMVQNLFPSCHVADSTCCLPSHCLLLHVSSSQGGRVLFLMLL